MTFDYIPKGVCARKFTIQVEDGVIQSVKAEGGLQWKSPGRGRPAAGHDPGGGGAAHGGHPLRHEEDLLSRPDRPGPEGCYHVNGQ